MPALQLCRCRQASVVGDSRPSPACAAWPPFPRVIIAVVTVAISQAGCAGTLDVRCGENAETGIQYVLRPLPHSEEEGTRDAAVLQVSESCSSSLHVLANKR